MSKKINEIYKEINEMMKCANNFDIEGYEQRLHNVEQHIGKEINRKDEQTDEGKLVDIFIEQVLKAIEQERTINTMITISQLLAQAEAEYRGLKTKAMNDGVTFFIDYLGFEDTTKTSEEHEETDDASRSK